MAAGTGIEWTEVDLEPHDRLRSQIPPGCDHCYALTMAKRLKGMGRRSTSTTVTRRRAARASA